jgi:hypothetical protein
MDDNLTAQITATNEQEKEDHLEMDEHELQKGKDEAAPRSRKNRQLDKILTYNHVLNISMLTNSLFTISSMDV